MASTSVVLPWSTCAIMAIFRMDCIGVQICASAGGQTKRAAGVSQPCFIPFKNDERNELILFYHSLGRRACRCAILALSSDFSLLLAASQVKARRNERTR